MSRCFCTLVLPSCPLVLPSCTISLTSCTARPMCLCPSMMFLCQYIHFSTTIDWNFVNHILLFKASAQIKTFTASIAASIPSFLSNLTLSFWHFYGPLAFFLVQYTSFSCSSIPYAWRFEIFPEYFPIAHRIHPV